MSYLSGVYKQNQLNKKVFYNKHLQLGFLMKEKLTLRNSTIMIKVLTIWKCKPETPTFYYLN